MTINNINCHFCKQQAQMNVLDVEFSPTQPQNFYDIRFICHCPLCGYNFALCALTQIHATETISMEEFHSKK